MSKYEEKRVDKLQVLEYSIRQEQPEKFGWNAIRTLITGRSRHASNMSLYMNGPVISLHKENSYE